jgi:DNA-binding SARP family transcriptional activator
MLAALDPLNARYALGLMRTMDAAGDRAGAIQHARIYETLVQEELDLPPAALANARPNAHPSTQ